MAPASWLFPSLRSGVGKKEGLLAYWFGGTLKIVPRPWARTTAGCSLSWRPLSPALPTLPWSNKFPSARPARAPLADPAPLSRPLTNSLSKPPGVEIATANALPRRESSQHVKEHLPRLGGRWEAWEVGTEGLI